MTNKEAWRNSLRAANDLRRGLSFIIANVSRAIAHSINTAAHRWPYAFMAVEMLVFVAIYIVSIGQARAERDSATHTSMMLQTKADSLDVLLELKNAQQ